MKTTSAQYSIDLRDFLHGLIIAAGTAAFSVIETSVNAGSLALNWKQAGLAALAGGLAYIGKKFFEPAKTVINANAQ